MQNFTEAAQKWLKFHVRGVCLAFLFFPFFSWHLLFYFKIDICSDQNCGWFRIVSNGLRVLCVMFSHREICSLYENMAAVGQLKLQPQAFLHLGSFSTPSLYTPLSFSRDRVISAENSWNSSFDVFSLFFVMLFSQNDIIIPAQQFNPDCRCTCLRHAFTQVWQSKSSRLDLIPD